MSETIRLFVGTSDSHDTTIEKIYLYSLLKNTKSKMLLQIHDELIFEVPKNDEKAMVKLIKEEMSSVVKSDYHSFSTPLTVDINSGDNWGSLH